VWALQVGGLGSLAKALKVNESLVKANPSLAQQLDWATEDIKKGTPTEEGRKEGVRRRDNTHTCI